MKAVANDVFLFQNYRYQDDTGTLRLFYRYENGPAFEETIVFPRAARTLSAKDRAALDAAFRLVFLLAGVSYAKAYVPESLKCEAFLLDEETATLVEKIYHKGLAEFAYRNKLNLKGRLHFAMQTTTPGDAVPLGLPKRALVAVGGGKDSIVSIEALKEAKMPLSLFALGGASGPAAPIASTIKVSGLEAVKVARTLSPNLVELNKAGATNGHVPITAILSAIAVAAAILQGFDAVVLSNERSASAPNLKTDDVEINHQYSKSFEFEKDFAGYINRRIAPDLRYFSLLRPFSEAEIAKRFAKLEKYHAVFRSCNTAFRQDEAARGKNWCGDCPKCRFVFLALAPFTDKKHLTDIFGKNLLDDKTQEPGFKELCGLSAHKPFECVGETLESALLMEKLAQTEAWKKDAVVAALGPRLKYGGFEKLYAGLFTAAPEHAIPQYYLRAIDAGR